MNQKLTSEIKAIDEFNRYKNCVKRAVKRAGAYNLDYAFSHGLPLRKVTCPECGAQFPAGVAGRCPACVASEQVILGTL